MTVTSRVVSWVVWRVALMADQTAETTADCSELSKAGKKAGMRVAERASL